MMQILESHCSTLRSLDLSHAGLKNEDYQDESRWVRFLSNSPLLDSISYELLYYVHPLLSALTNGDGFSLKSLTLGLSDVYWPREFVAVPVIPLDLATSLQRMMFSCSHLTLTMLLPEQRAGSFLSRHPRSDERVREKYYRLRQHIHAFAVLYPGRVILR